MRHYSNEKHYTIEKGGDKMSTQKKLSDLGLPAQEYESTSLSTVPVGSKLNVKEMEFKELGKYDGVVLTLATPIKVGETEWDKVHSSSNRVVKKLDDDIVRNALKDGPVEMTVTSGRTGNGTWYDLE